MMMPRDEIACQQLVELVTDYFEESLPPRQRELLEEHLQGCSGCRNYIEQMRQTIRLTGTVQEDEIPTDVRDGLLDVFRKWKSN
jgi:predicted anti-sigma-YlaC factor YlaD